MPSARKIQQRQDAATANRRQRDLAKIHLGKKALNLSEASYRALVGGIMDARGLAGEASAANLDARGRAQLLEAMRGLGWSGKRPQPAPPRPVHHADAQPDNDGYVDWRVRYTGTGEAGDAGRHITTAQAQYVGLLEDELSWTSEPQRLLGFIQRQLGGAKKTVPMLTNREASKVITGLERIVGRSKHTRSKARRAEA